MSPIKKFLIDLTLGIVKDGFISVLKTILEFVLIIAVACFMIFKVNQSYDRTQQTIVKQSAKIDSLSTEILTLTKLFRETAFLKNDSVRSNVKP